MSIILSANQLCKSFGARPLFSDLHIHIEKGTRLGLIGPNGSGKSTLLQILSGQQLPDQGEVIQRAGARVVCVPQSVQAPDEPMDQIIDHYLQTVRPELDVGERQQLIMQFLSLVGIQDHQAIASSLSGGWRKRFAIAKQLSVEPDLVFFDEPTNHLDLDSILWLEGFIRRSVPTYVVVSHDRAFLEETTNQVMEINPRLPKGMYRCKGSYSVFLEARNHLMSSQMQLEKALASKARRELEWLRKSPPARTCKSRSRTDAAHSLIGELEQVKGKNRDKKAEIRFSGTERETVKLLQGNNLCKSLGGKTLFSGIDIVLSPGTRLGLCGGNGTGKSTLLKIFAGTELPDQGTVKTAEGVKIVHFDQMRESLPLKTTLREALSEDGETVYYLGRPIHVSGWAEKFLFSKERLDQQLGLFSGGERARVFIARLMLQPADILLLDEPTNDLDIDTLQILEQSLADFPGAVVLITHDRLMMDEVCSEVIGLGTGSDHCLFADYQQWMQFQKSAKKTPKKSSDGKKTQDVKFTYKEKRELEEIEKTISQLEEEIALLEKEALAASGESVQKIYQSMGERQQRLEDFFSRWEELEEKRTL